MSDRIVRALFRLPLFYKILIANVTIVLVGAVIGTALTADFLRAVPTRSTVWLVGLFAVAGVAVSAFVNALILRLALSPLKLLELTAERVQQGDHKARAPMSPLADADLARLTLILNGMLDNLTMYRQRLQELTAKSLRAAEEERKRIALELHDETAQTLAALVIRMRVARGAKNARERDAGLDEVRNEMIEAIEGIRRFARGLRPPVLDQVGVVAAISEHVRSVCEATTLAVDFQADPVDQLLPPDSALALYRIAQEALANIMRHAAATTVQIRIQRQAETVVAEIKDDGRGFGIGQDISQTERGLGLFGMQERATQVGGAVEVSSEPGKGTSVRVEIPIEDGTDRA